MTPFDGVALRVERQSLGLTQHQLAARLGYGQKTISEWELGQTRMEHPEAIRLALIGLRAETEAARP